MSVTNHQECIRLSNVLSEILDRVGASEYIRRLRQNNAITNDILTTTCKRVKGDLCATYTFGSFAEGTTTPGLQSDIDTLICVEYPTVVEDPRYSDDIESLLLVQDVITPAGYAKLQWIEDGVVLFDAARENCSLDYFGRPVVCNNTILEGMTHDIRSGPAGTTLATKGFPDLDYVPSFQCRTWPEQARPWLYRLRSLGHPSAETIDAFKSIGCFLVPVGQPFTAEREIQWRLSFSVQERKIMMGLNTTQYKCYICLKMIKNDWIKPAIKGKSVTSYHCKTCLFYMLEVKEEKFWTTDNLIRCVFVCVNTIKIWVRNGFIPNYFIPEENMWKGNREMQEALVNILDKLLQTGPEFIFSLHCDHVGGLVQKALNEAGSELGHIRPKVEAALAVEKLRESNSTASLIAQKEESRAEDDENMESLDKSSSLESTVSVPFKESSKLSHSEDEIADIIVDGLLSAENSEQAVQNIKEVFPGCEDMIARLEDALRQNSGESISNSGEVNKTDSTVYSECSPCDKELGSKVRDLESLSDEEKLNTEERGSDKPDAQGENKVDGVIKTAPEDNGLLKKAVRTLDLALYKIHQGCIDSILGNGREMLELLRKGDDLDASIDEHSKAIEWLTSQVGRVSKVFTETEMERAVMFLLPYLHSSLGSHLAVKALKCTEDILREDYIDLSMSTLIDGYNCDAQSGILKHAAVLFMLGKYSECERILLELDNRYEPHVTSWGRCLELTDYVNEALCDKIRKDRPSTEEILHSSVCGCVIYLPAEIDIVPYDLKYEMFRSVFAVTPKIPEKDDFFECAHVDSAIFLYYLQYRLYQLLDRSEDDLKHALAMMVLVMQEDLNLGHPETANNLFGRILMDQRHWQAAYQCFCDSWRIRPDHNAAKWHLAVLLSEIVGVLNESDENVQDDEVDNDVIVLYKRTTSNYL